MRRAFERWGWLCSVGLAFAGCGDDETAGSGGGGSGASSGNSGNVEEQCTATLSVLQKDAYKDTAGRTSELWPPHTTTVLSVACAAEGEDPVEVDAAFMANHGTEPDDVDAEGTVILELMKETTVAGERADLLALLDAYRGCECDAATKFLSMDALQDEAVQGLVGSLVTYLEEHLVCTGAVDTAGLVALLQAGEIEQVIAALPSCSWDPGTDLGAGFDEALQMFLAQVQETLAGYHVCNNDAMLQVELFAGFEATGAVETCDPTKPVCSGPAWFYTP